MTGHFPVIKLAQVISVDDPQGGDRIKVKLYPSDASSQNSDIQYAWPLLPKMLHVKPQKNETVLIINAIGNDGFSQRYYIGPVISQQNHMESETEMLDAKSMLLGSRKQPNPNPELDPNTYGAFPNSEDISVIGRRSSELQLKLNEARLKAGVKVAELNDMTKISFNRKSPSYVKLKYHENETNGKIGSDGYKSTATVVADKIFLLGNSGKGANGKNDTFETSEVKYNSGKIIDDLITDDELNRAIENAHSIPYGDVLIRFLNTLTQAFIEHTHNYATLPPNPAHLVKLLAEKKIALENNELVSDNVKIN